MFSKFVSFLKHCAVLAITEAIAFAWAKIGNSAGASGAVADVDAFINIVGLHLGPVAAELVMLGEGPINQALKTAITNLGSTTTEVEITTYVIDHLGLKGD